MEQLDFERVLGPASGLLPEIFFVLFESLMVGPQSREDAVREKSDPVEQVNLITDLLAHYQVLASQSAITLGMEWVSSTGE